MENVLRCWADRYDEATKNCEIGSDEWVKAYLDNHDEESGRSTGATCFLPAGHDGPHQWTPDSSITVQFREVAAVTP